MRSDRFRTFSALGALTAAVGLVPTAMATPASAAHPVTVSVCRSGCAYKALAPALAAARDGDRIKVGPGRYAGGVIIKNSISLIGAGPGHTVITGVGDTSVLTVGVAGAPTSTQPHVSIRGITVTGGRVRTGPESMAFVALPGVVAEGGGIEVPFGAKFSRGATLTLTDVVVSGNRVAPRATAPVGPPCPDGHPCPFAEAAGGGINSWGNLTLDRVIVRHNRVGSASGLSDVASDANAGGIMSRVGTLTIRHSQISDNTASAVAPNGRFADGGGIFAESAAVILDDDVVSGNRAMLAAALPTSVDLLGIAGGVHIGGDGSGHVRNVRVIDNHVVMTNSVGDATAFSGGLHTDTKITVSHLNETGNSVVGATIGASTGSATVDSGGGELWGTVTDSTISGNRVRARSVAGAASAYSGGAYVEGTVTATGVSGNLVEAIAPRGVAHAGGGGIGAAATFTLTRSLLRHNIASARGRSGWARGGGVFGMLVPKGPPGGPLRIVDTVVSDNRAIGRAPSGGGVYATSAFPLSLSRSVVRRNHPDDVVAAAP